jgi:prophage regulatory protein
MSKQKRVHYVNAPELVPQQELLSHADLRTLGVPYSREHIWRLIKNGRFPKPVKFGRANSRCFFRRSEIQKWINRTAA